MAYNGSIELISGIKQKNNGNFPLVDATAVRVDDATRLDTKLATMTEDIEEIRNDAITEEEIEQLFML